MKSYSNCISCGCGLEPQEVLIPCYDDGGGLDSFDVILQYPTHPRQGDRALRPRTYTS